MNVEENKITRRNVVTVGATMVLGVTAGCVDSSEEEDEQANGRGDESGDDTAQSDGDQDDEQSDEESESEDAAEESESEDAAEEESAPQIEDILSIEETYVAPVSDGEIDDVYTPRSTVTTTDAFVVEIVSEETAASIELENNGVELLLNDQQVTDDAVELDRGESPETVTIGLSIDGVAEPGEQTLQLELDESIVDTPEDSSTLSKDIEFSVEEPEMEVLTDEIPPEDDFEIVIKTNIAPGQEIITEHQTKSGADSPFFYPDSADIDADGTAGFSNDYADFAGKESEFNARLSYDPAITMETDLTITE